MIIVNVLVKVPVTKLAKVSVIVFSSGREI